MNVTIYTVIGAYERVRQAFLKRFAQVTKTAEQADTGENEIQKLRLTLQDDTIMTVSINYKPDFIAQHIAGMHNFFARAPLENEKLKESVLAQIAAFNCVAGCEFDTDEDENRTSFIMRAFFGVASDINALLLFPDMSLYTSDEKLLLSIEGESEFETYIPIGNADFLDAGKEETSADAARRERSTTLLKQRNIPYLSKLRASVMQSQAKPRDTREIAERLLAMFGVCVYSEAVASGETPAKAQKYLKAVDQILNGRLRDCLTPKETHYLGLKNPDEQSLANFSWRYEGCLVLLWALGYQKVLPFPDAICDVSALARILWNQKSIDDMIKRAEPLPAYTLLDEADFILRLNWACVDARVNKKDMPASLDSGVVYERHYAFNWLIGANQGADWDNISPDT